MQSTPGSSSCKQTIFGDIRFVRLVSGSLLLFYFPILLNPYYYRDDYRRAISEQPGYSWLGRPIGDMAAYLFSSNWQYMPDSSPLFLIIALSITGATILYALKLRAIPFNAQNSLVVTAFIFNPIYIQCLLYRFDCLTMSIGYGLAILGWAVLNRSAITAITLWVLSMMAYQTFINIAIMLILMEAAYALYHGQNIKRFMVQTGRHLLYIIIALVIYFIISKFFLTSNAAARSDLPAHAGEYFIAIMRRIEAAYSRYFGALSMSGKIFYAFVIIVAFIEIHLHIYRSTSYSLRIVRSTLCSFFVVFFIAFSLGIMIPIASENLIMPRTIVAAGTFSCILVYLAWKFFNRFNHLAAWCIILLFLLAPLSFSYIVNRDVSKQHHYTQFIVEQLAMDLGNMDQGHNIIVKGRLPFSPLVKNDINHMRLARHIVPPADGWIISSWLQVYDITQLDENTTSEKIDTLMTHICEKRLAPIIQRKNYSIYEDNTIYFVWLVENNAESKNKACKKDIKTDDETD